MINIVETDFLHSDKDDTFAVKVREYRLFGWCYKREEIHSYNQRLIADFIVPQEPKKQKPIGFITNNTKKKKNGNKSKVSQS